MTSASGWIELRAHVGQEHRQPRLLQHGAPAGHPRQIQSARHRHQPAPLFKVDWPGAPRSSLPVREERLLRRPRPISRSKTKSSPNPSSSQSSSRPKKSAASTSGALTMSRLTAPPSTTNSAPPPRPRASRASRSSSRMSMSATPPPRPRPSALLAAVPNLGLNWAPGNAVMHGELDAFPPAGHSCPSSASCTATARMPCATPPPARSSGRPSTSASSTGSRSSARSNSSATATPSRWKLIGAARARPRHPLASAGPG